MFTWGSLCTIHYLKVVFNVTEAECASGITSLKFIFSYIEQKIESIQTLKKKKELHGLLTHGRCATLSHYPQAKIL